MKPEEFFADRWKPVALLTIPFFLVLTELLVLLDLPGVFEPPYLFLILNVLFTGIIPLLVAYIAFRSYQQRSLPGLILMGAGMLVFGLGSIAAPLVAGLPDGRNLTIAVHNVCALAAALSQLLGAAMLLAGSRSPFRTGLLWKIGLAVAIMVLLPVIVVAGIMQGLVPDFFVPGAGFTVLRGLVLAGAIEFFAIAAALFFLAYRRREEKFLFWYAIGLGLIAVGLLSAVFATGAGNPLSWTARSAQYLGCGFILIAFLALRTEALRQNVPVPAALAGFFGESGEGYRMLVANAPDAIVVHRDNRVLYANDAALRLSGMESLDQFGNIPLLDLVATEDREQVRAGIVRLGEGHPVPGFEMGIVRPDGVRISVETRAAMVDYAGGPAVLSVHHDITDRKRTEEQARAAEQELRLVMNMVPALMSYLDRDYRYRRVNRGYEEWFGFSPETIEGQYAWEVLGDEAWAKVKERIDRALAGERVSYEEYLPYQQGGGRWTAATLVPDRGPDGTIRGVVSLVLDITGRVRAEEALREKEEKYRELVENANSIILRLDSRLRVTFFNEYAAKFFGFSPEEILGRSVVGTILPDTDSDGRDLGAMVADIIARPERYAANENENIRKNGERVWIHWTNRPILNEDGSVRGLFAVGTDITGRRQAEAALKRESERLGILADSARLLLTSEDTEKIIQAVCDKVMAHLDCDVFFNHILDDDRKRLRLNAWAGIPDETAREIAVLEYGVAVCGCVARDSARIIAEDIQHTPDVRTDLVRSFGIDAYACHPLMYQGASIGTLSFGAKNRPRFSDADIELMKAVADLVSTAMARKRAEHTLSQALVEKDILLSEIHHRVKNNLSAFIALLSLEGSYEDTPAGERLKTDLQNRARSMALIHDTLYRTRNFTRVDMDMYLSTLVGQIAPLYRTSRPVSTEVRAAGTTIGLDRATPCGLIVNELVVNALKYAFPARAGSVPAEEPRISVVMIQVDGEYNLTVSDNGIGLPGTVDVCSAKTLGLKLVNFLARHQLRASVTTCTDHGTEFTIRFPKEEKSDL